MLVFKSLMSYRAVGNKHESSFFNLSTIALLVVMVFSSVALATDGNYKSGYAGAEAGDWGGKKGAAIGLPDNTCANMGAVGKVNLVSGFGLSIPGDATITGVEAFIKSAAGTAQDVEVQLASDATVDPPTPLGSTQILVSPGVGAGNCALTIISSVNGGLANWGLDTPGAITPAMVNDPAFGMIFRKIVTAEIKVDAICMEVTYSTPGEDPVVQEGCFEAPPPDVTTLTLQKAVSNDDGGTAVLTDWTLTATGPTPITGVTGAPSVTLATVDPGLYLLTESSVPGYTPDTPPITCLITGEGSLDGPELSLVEGDSAVCTFLNDDIAPELTIIKHVVTDDGGTATAGDWTMDVTATSPSSTGFPGAESPGTTITIYAGSYSVDESGGPAGYTKTLGAGCSGTLAVGETATCTITNDDVGPALTIVKTIVFDDQNVNSIGDFGIAVAGEGPVVFGAGVPGDPVTTVAYTATPLTLMSNTAYTLSEANLPGYSEGQWSCTNGDAGAAGGAVVTLDVGAAVTCSITNTRESFDLTLTKFMEPAGFPDTFIMDADGTMSAAGGNDTTVTAQVLYGDAAHIDELAGPGTNLNYWTAIYDCNYPDGAPFGAGAGARFDFTMPAANLDCVISNERKMEEVTFFKEAVGFDGVFCFDMIDVFGNPNEGPCIETNGGFGSTGGVGYVGHYQFNEILDGNFTLVSAMCSNGQNPEEGFDLEPGVPLTCTWVNMLPHAIPVNNPWALLLMVLMVLGVGWYYRPATMRQ